jgi:hypothetical protein
MSAGHETASAAKLPRQSSRWSDPPAADLIVKNKQKVLTMGASEAQAQALLSNRWYLLTVLTSLVTELERLSDVAERPDLITLAATASSEEESRFFAAGLQMLAPLNATTNLISRVIGQVTVIGFTADGAVVVPAQAEYVSWTERLGRFAERSDLKVRKRGIWLTGKTAATARQGFTRLGWTLNEAL